MYHPCINVPRPNLRNLRRSYGPGYPFETFRNAGLTFRTYRTCQNGIPTYQLTFTNLATWPELLTIFRKFLEELGNPEMASASYRVTIEVTISPQFEITELQLNPQSAVKFQISLIFLIAICLN
jgi:hypothetical protein